MIIKTCIRNIDSWLVIKYLQGKISLENPLQKSQINFNYKRIDLTNISLTWIKIWNILYFPQKYQININSLTNKLKDLDTKDLIEFMNRVLVCKQIDKIYTTLLSIL